MMPETPIDGKVLLGLYYWLKGPGYMKEATSDMTEGEDVMREEASDMKACT
jgi:hypothetical protein